MNTNTVRALLLILGLVAIASVTTISEPTFAGFSTSGLAGTSWQLVRLQDGDGNTLVPDDGSKYTITFGGNGRASVRVDCNRGGSSWSSSGGNDLHFGSWSMTRAKCAPGSLHDKIVTEGANVRSYTIKDGHLFLSGMASGGYYELEPLKTPQRRSSRRGTD